MIFEQGVAQGSMITVLSVKDHILNGCGPLFRFAVGIIKLIVFFSIDGGSIRTSIHLILHLNLRLS